MILVVAKSLSEDDEAKGDLQSIADDDIRQGDAAAASRETLLQLVAANSKFLETRKLLRIKAKLPETQC
jgi:hypothetical protein